MKIKFDDYRISLLTQLFDVTPDTIRLYGKKGILAPPKNEENNYRIFQRDDVFSMEYIMRLRQMQFALDDIKEIVCNDTLDSTQVRVDEKLSEIDKEIRHLIAIRKDIENYRDMLDRIRAHIGVIQIKEKTTLLLMDIEGSLPQTIRYLKSLDGDLEPVLTAYIPGTKGIQERHEDLLNEEKRQESNLVLTCEDVNGISAHKDFPSDRISIVNPSRYIFTISSAHTGVRYEGIEVMDKFIEENGLQRNGRRFSRYIATQNIYDEPIDYYETWTPIK